MTAQGTAGRSAVLVPVRGHAWFRNGEDVRGVDEVTGLAVVADVTGWVIDVEVPQVHPDLRSGSGLEAAVRRAIGAAMVHHLVANSKERVLSEDEILDARDLLSGRTTLAAPHVQPSPPMERPEEPLSPQPYHADERWSRRWTGRSDRGEITVVMSLIGGLLRLDADDEFLQTTSAELLRYALREAFQEADRLSTEELGR